MPTRRYAAAKVPARRRAAPAPAPAASAAAPAPAAAPKAGKQKPVRDSFTMPPADHALIGQIKQRALKLQQPAKKSEVLRAGLKALAAMGDAALRAVLQAVPPLKTGRPKKAETADAPKAAKPVKNQKAPKPAKVDKAKADKADKKR